MDKKGHLAVADNSVAYPGLCHCDRGEAHYADEDAEHSTPWQMPADMPVTWHIDLGGASAFCSSCGKPIPGGGHTLKCWEVITSGQA